VLVYTLCVCDREIWVPTERVQVGKGCRNHRKGYEIGSVFQPTAEVSVDLPFLKELYFYTSF
jgi:hypothetical protein